MHGHSRAIDRGSAPVRLASARRRGAVAALCAGVLLIALSLPSAAEARVAPEFFGVSAVDPDNADYQRMGNAGVGTYRILLSWPSVQSSADGPYDWSLPDLEVAGAASNGMQPFPFLSGSPRFAAATPQSAPLSRSALDGWRSFVTAAVTRYGPGGEFWDEHPELPRMPVHEWQVWNEQNAAAFWKPKPSPQRYAELLRASSDSIKAVDRSAEIVLGGMFGFPNEKRSIYMKDFLKRLYRIPGIRSSFDAVALHPYGGSLRLIRYQVSRARRIMDRSHDSGTPIWITEIGWATAGPDEWPLVTTRKGQAKLLRRAFEMLVSHRRSWGVRRVIWFAWRDFKQNLCRWCGGAGLVGLNGTAKPALGRFKQFTGAS
jgi:polysaccharide biosynthesis protein PslG